MCVCVVVVVGCDQLLRQYIADSLKIRHKEACKLLEKVPNHPVMEEHLHLSLTS